jgi:chaperonin GroES
MEAVSWAVFAGNGREKKFLPRLTPREPVHTLRRVLAIGRADCQNGWPRRQRRGGLHSRATEPQERIGATPRSAAPGGTGFMKIRPLQDRILVRRIEEEETTKGGIIIPDTAKEKPQEGKIIAVGKGKVSDDGKVTPLDVKKGDRILFSKYAGTEINIEGEEHLIIREDDVLGVVE